MKNFKLDQVEGRTLTGKEMAAVRGGAPVTECPCNKGRDKNGNVWINVGGWMHYKEFLIPKQNVAK